MQVTRPTSLRPGAAQPLAAKWLRPDDGADHVAIDVAVADPEPAEDMGHRLVDPAMDTERQRIAGRGDLVDYRVEPIGLPAHHMQDRPEHLAFKASRGIDLEGARREEAAVLRPCRQLALVQQPALRCHPSRGALQTPPPPHLDVSAAIG